MGLLEGMRNSNLWVTRKYFAGGKTCIEPKNIGEKWWMDSGKVTLPHEPWSNVLTRIYGSAAVTLLPHLCNDTQVLSTTLPLCLLMLYFIPSTYLRKFTWIYIPYLQVSTLQANAANISHRSWGTRCYAFVTCEDIRHKSKSNLNESKFL